MAKITGHVVGYLERVECEVSGHDGQFHRGKLCAHGNARDDADASADSRKEAFYVDLRR